MVRIYFMGSSISICYVPLNQGCWISSRNNRRTTSGWRRRWGLPFSLFQNWKKYPDFGKKDPNCVHLWVESIIQNVVLRLSSRKGFKLVSCRAFFLALLTRSLSKCPNSAKPPLPIKMSGCAPAQFYVTGCSVLILNQPWS